MSTSFARSIFITGASRSGTALVRSMLNNAPGVFLAGETHYFDDLRTKVSDPVAPLSSVDRDRCEEYFLALAHRPYGHSGDASHSAMDRSLLRTKAADLGSSADAYFEAFCQILSAQNNAERWGEKTPRHIYCLPTILHRYPQAQAICMIRDVRAVVASYRDWRNQGGFDFEKDPGHVDALEVDHKRIRQSYHPILLSLLWKGTVGAALQAQQRFGDARVLIQRYEDLVTSPKAIIERICTWLGIPFRDSMLAVPMHNSSFSKYDQSQGVSTEPLDRWKQKLSPSEIAIIQSACGRQLQQVGYELLSTPGSNLSVAWAWSTLPAAGVRALIANRSRMGSIPGYLWRRLKALS